MKRHIHLKDFADIPTPHNDRYSALLMAEGRAALVARDLRFDNTTGRIHDATGELERYVTQSEFTPHTNVESVMRWEFSRYIANSAGRLSRGYSA